MANATTIGLCGQPIRRVRHHNPLRNMLSMEGTHLALSKLFESLLAAPRGGDAPDLATELLCHLSNDLPLGLRELEVEMSASISSSADPAEWNGKLAHLRRRHKQLLDLSERVRDGLEALALGGAPQDPLRFVVAAFALIEALRGELTWEDRRSGTPVSMRDAERR